MITPASPCTGSTITQASPWDSASSASSASVSPNGMWVTPGSSGWNGSWNIGLPVTLSAPSVLPW